VIDILIPCLGRPESIPRLQENWQATCPPDSELVFIISPHDIPVMQAVVENGATSIAADWRPGRGDYGMKMNLAYRKTEREWLFLGAQDIHFTEGWFDQAMRHSHYDVIATNDRANRQVMRGEFGTHCLVRRSYVDEQGASADGPYVLIHEGYDHNFVDRELCGVAKNRGVFAFAKRSVVEHSHPLWRTADWDDTYRKGLAKFQEDRRLYLSRAHLWDYAGLSSHEVMQAKGGLRRRSGGRRSKSAS
jgi:hypothetical protein